MVEHESFLMRTCYNTNFDPNEPNVPGSFSRTIPASAFRDGTQIVHVDWELEPGFVWVTFLKQGRSPSG